MQMSLSLEPETPQLGTPACRRPPKTLMAQVHNSCALGGTSRACQDDNAAPTPEVSAASVAAMVLV